MAATPSSDALDATTRLALAEQCRAVTLSDHGRDLVDAAVDLHLVGNDGSGERFETEDEYRPRAEMGYAAEVAVAEYYGLTPTVDYRPPKQGDAGHDYRVRMDGETLTVDVKATKSLPPRLYLTKKRKTSDRYTVPDAYLLCATDISDEADVHLVGWARSEEIIEHGTDRVVHENPVWTLEWGELSPPPSSDRVESLPSPRRELWAAADRAGIDADVETIHACEHELTTEHTTGGDD